MNKLFKLIYVYLLGLFDINKIKVAREEGVKSNLEKKTVITGIILVFYGYLLYKLFMFLNFSNNIFILGLGFFISSIVCLVIDLYAVEPILFKNEDNEMLFAMPLSRQQILFSKLFSIYLRNMIYVLVIMVSSIIAYVGHGEEVNDTFGLMFGLETLMVPFIPIVCASFVSYVNDYFKVNYNNDVRYKILKWGVILGISLILLALFIDFDFNSFDDLLKRFYIVYPNTYLFIKSLGNESLLAFVSLIGISIIFITLYYKIITDNYLRICSKLKGVKKKDKFVYKKTRNLHCVLGIFRKEFSNLFQNKYYLTSSYGILVMFSFILFVFFKYFDFSQFESIPYFEISFNTYLPTILAMLVTISGSAVSSVSLEKNNLQMLATMPISIEKVLMGKWLLNVFIGSIFVFINGVLSCLLLEIDKLEMFFCFAIPFVALLFISLTAVILDFRFVEKVQTDDNAIIKQRLVTLVPMFLAIFVGIGPLLLPGYEKYHFLLGSYLLVMLIAIIMEICYFEIIKKKLIYCLYH